MRQITFANALREALQEEMRNDKNVFVMGTSIQTSVWGVTKGFGEEFTERRAINAPISENGFVGAGLGAALLGLKPVVELLYGDFLLLAADAIVNEIAKYRYMCGGGDFKVPITIRVAGSGIGSGSGPQHSQSLESAFINFPGLKIVVPSTPYDAKGLLKTAIHDNNPVLFVEYKLLYGTRGEVPENDYRIPFGEAKIRREGKNITILAIGNCCQKALDAADELSKEGFEAEVIDPRTIIPFDKETVFNSLHKTNKLVIVEDGIKRGGIGSEVAAIVAEEALTLLDAPIMRIGGKDAPIPASKYGEKYLVPSVEEIIDICKKIIF